MTLGQILSSAKTIFIPHYFINIVLGVIYFVLKTLPPFCGIFFTDCSLELVEWEWLTFLACIIVIKERRKATAAQYIGTACLFIKTLSGFLFFRTNAAYGIVYGVVCLLHFIFIPEPIYQGPEEVTYFRGPNLEEELRQDKRVTWLICFYAAWSPPCVTFSSVFAQLSSEYSLENLKFGKIDVSRYTDVGKKYRVDGGTFSKQLPTLILFENGEETHRKPFISPKGTVIRYSFLIDEVMKDFEINVLYDKCKKNPLKKNKNQKKDN